MVDCGLLTRYAIIEICVKESLFRWILLMGPSLQERIDDATDLGIGTACSCICNRAFFDAE